MTKRFDNEFNKIMGVETPAFFISPEGKPLAEREGRHIYSIVKYPKVFGLDVKYIKDLYKKYGEHYEHEGKARNEIFLDLMKKGWIRVRYIPSNQLITLQTHNVTNKIKENVWDFLRQVKDGKVPFPDPYIKNADVSLQDTSGNVHYAGSINDVMKRLYENNFEKRKRKPIVEITNF